MRTRPTVLALLAVAGSALVPAVAAAATWSAPATVTQTPRTFAGPLQARVAGDGAIVASWSWQDGVGDDATRGASAAARPALQAFGPERPAPEGLLDVATYARARTLALVQDTGGLRIAYGRSDGSFGVTRNLVRGDLVFRPQMAVAPDGRGLIAWIENTRTPTGSQRRIVRAVERQSDGTITAPRTLSGAGRADAVAVAAGAHGDEAIAVVRDGRVLARVRRAGHGWGSLLELARARRETRWQVLVGVAGRGEVRLVWRRSERTVNGVPGRRALEGASMPAGRFRFQAAQVIEADAASGPVLTAVPTGWAIAYILQTSGGPRPAVRLTDGGPAFGAPRYAAPAQGGVRAIDVAYTPGTGLTLAWIQPIAGQNSDGVARAATLGTDGFGPVEDVSPAEAVHEVHLAPDAAAGRPVAVWSARPEGTGPGVPIADIRTVVRSAMRMS